MSKAPLLRKYIFMTLASMTAIFDLATVRAGSQRDNWLRAFISLVVAWSSLLQGCLPGVWVAAVAVDSMRSGTVVYGPFEQSWVASRDRSGEAVRNLKVTSIAVLPVEGDPEMGERLATMLQQDTALRVEVPTSIAAGDTAVDPRSAQADDADRRTLAKEVTRNLGVDAVLVSRVDGLPAHPTDWGWKAEGPRRLYLYLMNRDGDLLWKDELPFTLVKGSTSPQDASVQTDLSSHVMQHVKELRLDELGYLPKKAIYKIPKKSVTLTR
jgi:hypothetical protein